MPGLPVETRYIAARAPAFTGTYSREQSVSFFLKHISALNYAGRDARLWQAAQNGHGWYRPLAGAPPHIA